MSIHALNWAQSVVRGSQLSTNERFLLFALAKYHSDKSGQCIPSVKTLAEISGLCERRVQMNMRKLESLGLVTVVKRSAGGLQTSNQYDLLGVTKKADRLGVTGGGRAIRVIPTP